MKLLASLGLALLVGAASPLLVSPAPAATLVVGTLTLNVASTSLSCPLPTNLVAPLAAGTTICTVSVLPAGWQGVVSAPTGGADSSKFSTVTSGGATVIQNNVALSATGSAAGNASYAIGTITSTP